MTLIEIEGHPYRVNRNMKKYSGSARLAMIVIAVIAIGGIAAIGTTRSVSADAAKDKTVASSTGGTQVGLAKLPSSTGSAGIGMTKLIAPKN